MPNPQVSVVVAVHNAGRFLEETVASVLAQSWSDFELLLVDDGSSDGCLDFVAHTADPRIRIVPGKGEGAAVAVNVGLEAASGEWIALLDHDDLWASNKLAVHMRSIAQHPECDLTFDWSHLIDAQGNDLGLPTMPWRGEISFEQLLEDFVIGTTSAILVRRAVLQRAGYMNPSLRLVYDLDFCLRVAALRPGNCRSVAEYLTFYRRHGGQLSEDFRKLKAEWERLLTIVPGYAPRPLHRQTAIADSNMRRYFAWLAVQAGDPWSAMRLALSAFRRAPARALLDRRNWMMLAVACGRLALPGMVYRGALNQGKKYLR